MAAPVVYPRWLQGAATRLDAARALLHTRGTSRRDLCEGRAGCAICGDAIADSDPPLVLPDLLAEQWRIGRRRQRLYDAREGLACRGCGATGRSRSLALAFLEATGQGTRAFGAALQRLHGVPFAEINGAKELHGWLEPLQGLHYSEYGSTDPSVPSEDLEKLSYADASLHFVFCSDTLEHVPDPERALAELVRVLVPGGAALLTVPVLWHRPTRVRAELAAGRRRDHCPPSYHGSRALRRAEDGFFVFREFGPDLIGALARHGEPSVVFLDLWRNPFQCAFILRKR